MFKLLAIRTFSSPTIEENPKETKLRRNAWKRRLRILQTDQLYQFYTDYDISDENVEKKGDGLPDDFYNTSEQKDDDINISISALVGKNGMGMSSLIELYIRIINNAACCLYNGLRDSGTPDLRFVRFIYARVYFEIDEHYAYLDQDDEKMSFKIIREPNPRWNSSSQEAKTVDAGSAKEFLVCYHILM